MKRILCLLFLSLTPLAVAQEIEPGKPTAEQKAELRRMLVEAKAQAAAMKRATTHIALRVPDITAAEKSLAFALREHGLTHEEIVAYTGMTKEKAVEIRSKMENLRMKLGKARERTRDILQTDDPKEQAKIADRYVDTIFDFLKETEDMLEKELTPGQLNKLRDLRLVYASPNFGIELTFDFGQYGTLDLSEEQRKRIEEIRGEYTSEFVPLVEKLVPLFFKKEELNIAWELADGKDEKEAIAKEMDEGIKAGFEQTLLLTQLHARTRAKIVAVLSKEQLDRMEKILAGAPKYLREQLGLDEKRDDSWKESWKPGDPIPEPVRKMNPNSVFPRGL